MWEPPEPLQEAIGREADSVRLARLLCEQAKADVEATAALLKQSHNRLRQSDELMKYAPAPGGRTDNRGIGSSVQETDWISGTVLLGSGESFPSACFHLAHP